MPAAASRLSPTFPACFGHRGASAAFPENTLASFEAAIRDGAEGIESDVHLSADNVVIMFHDPALDRTTDTTGLIKDRQWFGDNGIQHARTLKSPRQSIPTFQETIDLLMKPENRHVHFNIDVKPHNNPVQLFPLLHKIISTQDQWEALLAPRLVLGLWHPKFISVAREHIPYCRRSYLGNSFSVARKYFWNECDTFSVEFGALTTIDGERFRKECKAAGKKIMTWTVNEPNHLMECVRWGVDVIITDHTKRWLDLRKALQTNATLPSKYSRLFLWTTLDFYTPVVRARASFWHRDLRKTSGPFDGVPQTVKTSA